MRTTVNIQDSNKIAKEKNNDRRIKWNLKTDLSVEMTTTLEIRKLMIKVMISYNNYKKSLIFTKMIIIFSRKIIRVCV